MYKVYVYGRLDRVAVFKKALDLTVEERHLKPGDKIYIIVSHPSWSKPFFVYDYGRSSVFYNLLKAISEFVEYKSVRLKEVVIEVQSTKIPRALVVI